MSKHPLVAVYGLVSPNPATILLIRRGKEPYMGQWSFPGGFVHVREDWRYTLKRQILAKACVVVSAAKEHMTVFDAHTTSDGRMLVLFACVVPKGVIEIRRFTGREDTLDRRFQAITSVDNLGHFPLMQEVFEKYVALEKSR